MIDPKWGNEQVVLLVVVMGVGGSVSNRATLSSLPHPYPAIPIVSVRARRSRSFMVLVGSCSSSIFFYTSPCTMYTLHQGQRQRRLYQEPVSGVVPLDNYFNVLKYDFFLCGL